MHPTQIYASLVEFALFVLLLWFLHRPHRDGEILGAWLFLGGLSSFLRSTGFGGGGDGAREDLRVEFGIGENELTSLTQLLELIFDRHPYLVKF